MAKVSLLGDSIMFQNYGPVVEMTLRAQFTVFHGPGENGRYSAYDALEPARLVGGACRQRYHPLE